MENIRSTGAILTPKQPKDESNAIIETNKKRAELMALSQLEPTSPELQEALKGGYSQMTTQVARAVKAGVPKDDIEGLIETQVVFDEIDMSDLNTLMIKNNTLLMSSFQLLSTALFGKYGYMASGYVSKKALELTLSGKTDPQKQEILNKERDIYKKSESNALDSFTEGLLGANIGVNSELVRKRSEADVTIATAKSDMPEMIAEETDEYKDYVKENGKQMAEKVFLPYLTNKMKKKKNYAQYLDSASDHIDKNIRKNTKMLEEKYEELSGVADDDTILKPIIDLMHERNFKRPNGEEYTDEETLEIAKSVWIQRRFLPENWEEYTPDRSVLENASNVVGSLAGLLVNTVGIAKIAGGLGKNASAFGITKYLAPIRNGKILKYAPNVPEWIYGFSGYEGIKKYEDEMNLGNETGPAVMAGLGEFAKIGALNYGLYGVVAPMIGHAILTSKLSHYVYSSTKIGQSSQGVSKLSKLIKYDSADVVKFGAKVTAGSTLMGVENIGLNLMDPNAVWDDDMKSAVLIGGAMSAIGLMNDDFSHNIGRIWAIKGGQKPSPELMNAFKDKKWGIIADMVKETADHQRIQYLVGKYSPEIKVPELDNIVSPDRLFQVQRSDKDNYRVFLDNLYGNSDKSFEQFAGSRTFRDLNESFSLIEHGKTLELYQNSNQINRIEGGMTDDIINRAKRVENGEDIHKVNEEESIKNINKTLFN